MKIALCVLVATVLLGQDRSSSTAYTTDLNGNRVAGPSTSETKSKSGVERTERLESINGRLVPREQVEERVLRDDASGKTVERIVRRFDANGQAGPPEKTLIEEQKSGENTTIRTTTYRGDLNGNLQLAERSLTEKRKSGSLETTETSIDRPTVNGTFETVEKRSVAKTAASGGGYEEMATIFRRGGSGMYVAQKLVTSHSENNGEKTDNVAEYEVGSSGSLVLHGQTVTRSAKRPDGSEVAEVDEYGSNVPGTVGSAGSGLKLQERQYVEKKKGEGGTVETVSVQRPSVSDPGKLGPPKVIAEKVCRGKCE
jgi:hypothetical protein